MQGEGMEKVKKNTGQKKDSKIGSIILQLFVGGLFGIVVGFIIAMIIDKGDIEEGTRNYLFDFAVFMVSLLVGYFIQIIVHETGHLLGGLLSGYQFVSFRIGSFTIIKEGEKIRLKKFTVLGSGGQCIMMPPDVEPEKCPNRLYNAGGVLANLLLSTIAVLILLSISMPQWLKIFIMIFGAVGYFIALTNGIPMKLSGIANDGYNLYILNKDPLARRSVYISMKVIGLLSKGKRFKELPLEWFLVEEGADFTNHLTASMKINEGNWYMDHQQFEKTKECFQFLLQPEIHLIEVYRNELNCELLFIEIITNGEKEKIEELYTKKLKQYIKATSCYVSRRRLMYAYYKLIEKDMEKAEKALQEFEKTTKTYPIKGEILMEQDLIKYIDRIKVE